MLLFPAIDLYEGKAVRLYKGDYARMTVYSDRPEDVAEKFALSGVKCIHVVDLEGALNGGTPNFETVLKIKRASGLFCEIGGGIRSMQVIDKYLGSGIDRVILGTSAVKDESLLKVALAKYPDRIAVGIDIKDGKAAIHGWTEKSELDAFELAKRMADLGVRTLICTDISKDGALTGVNTGLYRKLSDTLSIDITASGGVKNTDDIKALSEIGLYGSIIGKAYYMGAVDLTEALEAAK
ncbi:MAG: 1-(5-phosphoribosyl)-5-[Clostridia bacterium]|nr:1-(5-phosphoribosyl)-5-[(5-phosphoribosylamino)methylideneamino]imidazole-4-carboxamide isomerase [Clostridia bacterium]